MAVPLRLLAVISVRRRHMVADLMVDLHPHLRMVEGVRLPMAVAALCLCRRMAVAGLQLRRTVGVGRHLTVVAVTPVVDSVVAVTPAVGLVAAVAQADSAAEVVATYRQEAGAITVVVAGVTGIAKLISKIRTNAECRPWAAFFLVSLIASWCQVWRVQSLRGGFLRQIRRGLELSRIFSR
jgi:hypothetical protein